MPWHSGLILTIQNVVKLTFTNQLVSNSRSKRSRRQAAEPVFMLPASGVLFAAARSLRTYTILAGIVHLNGRRSLYLPS
jgi:hypothetical protein